MIASVIGLGHMGCASAAWLSRIGHTVIGVDVERQHAELASAEVSSRPDPRLEKLINLAASFGKFRRAPDVRTAVLESDVSVICVATSSNANGSQNLRDLDRVFRQIGTALGKKREYHVIVVRTAVLPGTTEGRFTLLLQQHSGRRAGADFGICMNPAFSWNTSGIEDLDHPPQIVIGELDSRSGDTAQQLYNGADAPIIRTTIHTAEMLNYVSSAFHAIKITFANEIENLCATHGIDGQEVLDLCLEREFNTSCAHLAPSFAFGGRRLTKDLRALLHRAKEQDVDCPLLNAILPSNQQQILRAMELVEKTQRSKIGILGLGAKAGSSDMQENPIIHLAEMLTGKGYRVRIFDDNAQLPCPADANAGAQGASPRRNITGLVSPSLEDVVQDSEVVVLASRDTAIRDLPELLSENHILIDLAGAARQFKTSLVRKHASP